MKNAVWILQILLAFHTAIGAIWKFTNPAATVPSLSAIPHSGWMALIALELLCAAALVLGSVQDRFAKLIKFATIAIIIEMLLFCGVAMVSGAPVVGELVYWVVVAVVCAVINVGRGQLRVAE